MKKTSYAFIAAALFFFSFIIAEESPLASLVSFILVGYLLQKAGIVNWKDEITKPY